MKQHLEKQKLKIIEERVREGSVIRKISALKPVAKIKLDDCTVQSNSTSGAWRAVVEACWRSKWACDCPERRLRLLDFTVGREELSPNFSEAEVKCAFRWLHNHHRVHPDETTTQVLQLLFEARKHSFVTAVNFSVSEVRTSARLSYGAG